MWQGTAALLTAISHPAVKACNPAFAFLDLFSDVAFMGGICLTSFIKDWDTISTNVLKLSWIS